MDRKKEDSALDNDRALLGGWLRRDHHSDGIHSVSREHALIRGFLRG